MALLTLAQYFKKRGYDLGKLIKNQPQISQLSWQAPDLFKFFRDDEGDWQLDPKYNRFRFNERGTAYMPVPKYTVADFWNQKAVYDRYMAKLRAVTIDGYAPEAAVKDGTLESLRNQFGNKPEGFAKIAPMLTMGLVLGGGLAVIGGGIIAGAGLESTGAGVGAEVAASGAAGVGAPVEAVALDVTGAAVTPAAVPATTIGASGTTAAGAAGSIASQAGSAVSSVLSVAKPLIGAVTTLSPLLGGGSSKAPAASSPVGSSLSPAGYPSIGGSSYNPYGNPVLTNPDSSRNLLLAGAGLLALVGIFLASRR